jgi:hypothetical protein
LPAGALANPVSLVSGSVRRQSVEDAIEPDAHLERQQ